MEPAQACACAGLKDLAVVGMGQVDSAGNPIEESILGTFDTVRDHGGRQWWLYASVCTACGQGWMIAQEERVHDNYGLKRLSAAQLMAIVEDNRWPDDFMRFEDVLRLGPDSGMGAIFLNPLDATETVAELVADRPDITPHEVAYLLCLSPREATRLMNRRGSRLLQRIKAALTPHALH